MSEDQTECEVQPDGKTTMELGAVLPCTAEFETITFS